MTTLPTRRALLGALPLAAGLAARPAAAQAAPWPQAQPIRMIVPFGAGGATDIAARVIAQEMTGVLGQSIVLENRGGAGSTLGTGYVARAAADGYTLLITTISGRPSARPSTATASSTMRTAPSRMSPS
ncbi:tripartite tricarboxylate transporter substrate-binding protein [Teichococcus aestuarii]|uniref:tripartite tricarboxylate transporter substrate-binding protein n=1 Tax=Teichococcus aestuarii TaxID=568898 RepID=UPI00360A2891